MLPLLFRRTIAASGLGRSWRPVAGEEERAAVVIQAHTRGYLTRKEFARLQEIENEQARLAQEKLELSAKIKLRLGGRDSLEVSHRERVRADNISGADASNVERERERERERAAIVIQAHTRGFLTRKEQAGLREMEAKTQRQALENEAVLRRNEAATTIQAHFRGFRAREGVAAMRRTRAEEEAARQEAERERAAIVIQAHTRGHLSRREAAQLRQLEAEADARKKEDEEREARDRELAMQRDAAATTIQAHFRGFRAREDVAEMRRMRAEEECAQRERAAIVIQAHTRGHLARKMTAAERQRAAEQAEAEAAAHAEAERRRRSAAATSIQAHYRGYSTRKEMMARQRAEVDRARRAEEEERAAVTIQAHMRGHLARKEVALMKRLNKESEERRREEAIRADLAAVHMQGAARGFLGRCETRARKWALSEAQARIAARQRRQEALVGRAEAQLRVSSSRRANSTASQSGEEPKASRPAPPSMQRERDPRRPAAYLPAQSAPSRSKALDAPIIKAKTEVRTLIRKLLDLEQLLDSGDSPHDEVYEQGEWKDGRGGEEEEEEKEEEEEETEKERRPDSSRSRARSGRDR